MRFFIGIDTGENTGFAIWDAANDRFLTITTYRLHEALYQVLLMHKWAAGEMKIVFEDARQRKWIPREKSNAEYRGRLMGAGSVKRDAAIWEEFCRDWEIPYEAVPPCAGATKWNEAYWKKVTGWTKRTSEHARDAALLVFQRKR